MIEIIESLAHYKFYFPSKRTKADLGEKKVKISNSLFLFLQEPLEKLSILCPLVNGMYN